MPRQYLYEPNASCNNDPAFVFKLNSGAAIKNVCLIGPKTDIKDWRWAFWFKNNCMSGTGSLLPAHEGVVGGILISGNKCEVSGCEIYGFPSFGILVRDMLVPLTNHAFDWGQCYDIRNPNDKGTATIANNYIHNCMAYGIYVSNPVYKYTSDKYPLPTEEAFITNNIFKNNQRNIVYSGITVKISIANNRYM
ncbi:MAG: hypothetical protein IPJ79_13825 [Bacteroidetes bacterium]|nr:hypothetical protein [Bacteroidota bacterium]